jgi:hypothetical protein
MRYLLGRNNKKNRDNRYAPQRHFAFGVHSLVSSDVGINPQFYWGKPKSFSDEKNGELYASRELHGIIKTV